MLRLRDTAKTFCRREVGNGRHISFWYDNWSAKGVLVEKLGERGIIAMGIKKDATIEEAVMCTRRRRNHRAVVLNEIETELVAVKEKMRHFVMDATLWRRKSGLKFFSLLMRPGCCCVNHMLNANGQEVSGSRWLRLNLFS